MSMKRLTQRSHNVSKTKPALSLLSGAQSFDLDSLVALFKQVAGRDPTPEELEDARQELEKTQS